MENKITILTCILTLFFISCEENEIKKDEEEKFVPGDVIIGIKSDIAIDLVFDLMNNK